MTEPAESEGFNMIDYILMFYQLDDIALYFENIL
jgi:hypothetical protein